MKIKYSERAIAYIDILGFTELIKESEKTDSLVNYIFEAVQDMRNLNERGT